MLKPKIKYTEEQKELIINTYLERGSLRGMQRLFGVVPETLMGWIKKVNNRSLSDELLDAHPTDVLELDELWSFLKARRHKFWTWIALCRRTRQVIAYVCGRCNDKTCTDLRCRIPIACFNLATCSDYWSSYAEVFDPNTHRSVGKHTGLTNYVERFNTILRNRLGRFTRKTLGFSKKKANHEAVLHMFLLKYNQDMNNTSYLNTTKKCNLLIDSRSLN